MRNRLSILALCISLPLATSPAQAQRQPAKGFGPPQFQQPILPPVPLDAFTFQHPMTVINRAELDEVKRRIAAHIEPQATAFAKLIADADAALAFHPDPPDKMNIMGGYEPNTNQDTVIRPWLWRNCHAAYATALAYAYTGDTRYAEKAVEVLNTWAKKGTSFVGGDRGLQLGSWFSPMLYAADLLHDYAAWKPADRKRFNTWWRRMCLPYTLETMHSHSNNWKDAGVLGVMAAAVVLEDKPLLSRTAPTTTSKKKAHGSSTRASAAPSCPKKSPATTAPAASPTPATRSPPWCRPSKSPATPATTSGNSKPPKAPDSRTSSKAISVGTSSAGPSPGTPTQPTSKPAKTSSS